MGKFYAMHTFTMNEEEEKMYQEVKKTLTNKEVVLKGIEKIKEETTKNK